MFKLKKELLIMRIYVANLGKYNEGILKGGWIDLPISEEALQEFLKDVVGLNEQYEEWAIHDYECDFMDINEYDNIQELNEIAELLEGMDDHEEKKIKGLIDWGYFGNAREAIENHDDFILHEDIKTEKDLGYYLIEDAGIYDLSTIGNLANYIDYESFGKDVAMESEGYFSDYGWIERM
jgi:antirestriction protein